MRQCPQCGSPRIHRSRSRGLLEQVRKTVTSKRLHRCHSCGWRGWGVETDNRAEPELPGGIRPSPNLKVIDAVVMSSGDSDSRKGHSGKTAGDGRHHRKSKSHL